MIPKYSKTSFSSHFKDIGRKLLDVKIYIRFADSTNINQMPTTCEAMI